MPGGGFVRGQLAERQLTPDEPAKWLAESSSPTWVRGCVALAGRCGVGHVAEAESSG